MARTQATTTIQASRLALGERIIYEDALAVVQQQNHTFGNRPQLHLSCTTAPAGWNTGTVHTLRCTFENSVTGTWRTELDTFIRIDPDTVTLQIGVRCVFTGTDTGDVRVIIGGATTDITGFAAGNSSDEWNGSAAGVATVATSSTGTGRQLVTVQLQRTAGTTAAYMRNFRIQDAAITSSLPGPVND